MLSEDEFNKVMDGIRAKLTEEEIDILGATFAGAEVHGTRLYMMITAAVGFVGGALLALLFV